MLDLVENVVEIAKIAEWSIASDEMCPEKTYVSAENICRNRRENVQFQFNFSSISVQFQFNFSSISVQFQFNFSSISVQFQFNFSSISVQFYFILSMEHVLEK